MERQEGACGISNKSVEYSIAHMTQEGVNVITPIFYNEMTYFDLFTDILPIMTIFLPPDEVLRCGQL